MLFLTLLVNFGSCVAWDGHSESHQWGSLFSFVYTPLTTLGLPNLAQREHSKKYTLKKFITFFNRRRSILFAGYSRSFRKTGSRRMRRSDIPTSQSSTTRRQSSCSSQLSCRHSVTTSSWASTSTGRSSTRSSGRIRPRLRPGAEPCCCCYRNPTRTWGPGARTYKVVIRN